MYAEDTAWMGLFHYLSRGFVNQPTDYDPRPLMYVGEKHLARGGGNNAQYCIGQRHQIEVRASGGRGGGTVPPCGPKLWACSVNT